MSSRVRTLVVESWEDFQAIARDPAYRSWAFRGQADARWPMYSSLSRHVRTYGLHRDSWREQEQRILRIFRRKAHHFLEHVPDRADDFEWLALMQHHGAPTRLLDFTWSPYVAAFFALERATVDAVVWAIFPLAFSRHRTVRVRGKTVRPNEMGPWRQGNYERYFLAGERAFVVVGEPPNMNQRLIAQSGTFAVPSLLDEPIEDILSDYPDPERLIVKIVLRTEKIRDQAMWEMYNMNITHATLFPDLDGLARSLAYELEFHWAYDPRTMARFHDEPEA
ncbi:MAG: FRG domain-containing protein [Acidobacteriota bacterium]